MGEGLPEGPHCNPMTTTKPCSPRKESEALQVPQHRDFVGHYPAPNSCHRECWWQMQACVPPSPGPLQTGLPWPTSLHSDPLCPSVGHALVGTENSGPHSGLAL